MEQYVIKGGTPLVGEVEIGGAKNAALAILAAAIMTDETVIAFVRDVPVDYDSMKKIRASYYLLGSLLGKYKRAEVILPGGCNIGSRPMDLHIKGFRALGATVEIRGGAVAAQADRLRGNHIYLDKVSVGATINIMMAASMA